MKYAIIPILTLLFLNQINDRLMDMETGYVLLIYSLALIPSMISIFYKFKKDKEEGKFTYARQGISMAFITGTIIFAIIQQFMY